MSEFYMPIARKTFSRFFWRGGGGHVTSVFTHMNENADGKNTAGHLLPALMVRMLMMRKVMKGDRELMKMRLFIYLHSAETRTRSTLAPPGESTACQMPLENSTALPQDLQNKNNYHRHHHVLIKLYNI